MNLYWSVYKNLENELIDLSDQIHFDDKQINVYSVKIAELLIRCAVEIESISKDLFLANGGVPPNDSDLYFDTHCLELLEHKWKLSSRHVLVSAQNVYFAHAENKILTPLKNANKRGTSGSNWKKAYQAVKHNRAYSLSKGNIKHPDSTCKCIACQELGKAANCLYAHRFFSGKRYYNATVQAADL